MKETTHTKEPWFTYGATITADDPQKPGDTLELAYMSSRRQNWKADLKVLAAAPELLAALQIIADRLDRWKKGDVQPGPQGKDADWTTLTTQVHDAIRKATT